MLVSAIKQHESIIGIHMSPPSWASLPPSTPSFPSRVSWWLSSKEFTHQCRRNGLSPWWILIFQMDIIMLLKLWFWGLNTKCWAHGLVCSRYSTNDSCYYLIIIIIIMPFKCARHILSVANPRVKRHSSCPQKVIIPWRHINANSVPSNCLGCMHFLKGISPTPFYLSLSSKHLEWSFKKQLFGCVGS